MNFKDYFKILSYEEVVSFGKAQRNRKVNDSHVNDFYTIIKGSKYQPDENGEYLVFGIIPVIVNPVTKHILDGQHRLEAFIKAYEKGDLDDKARILVGFWRIDDEDEENLITVMLNSKTKNWTIDDYMKSYSQYKDSFFKLVGFCRSHSLCHSLSKAGKEKLKYRYAAAMITGKGQQTALKSGSLSFTDEQLKLGNTIHNELLDIRKRLNLPMTGDEIEYMATEWHTQRNYVSSNEIKSLKYLPASVREMKLSNRSDWRVMFSQLKDLVQRESYKKAV